MREYFKPWRRKIGVLVLVYAGMVVSEWLLMLSLAGSSGGEVINLTGIWVRIYYVQRAIFWKLVEQPLCQFRIPLWFAAIVLTLLAGWLLLSKPRRFREYAISQGGPRAS